MNERKKVEYPGYKSSFGTIYSNIPYRVCAHWLATIIYKFPITPNQISISAMIMSFIGSYLFSLQNYSFNIVGIALINLFCILACSDGLVARLQGKSSVLGAYINHVTEKFSYFAIFLSIILNVSLSNENIFSINIYIVGIIFIFTRMVTYDIELKIFELSNKIEKYENDSYDIINANFKSNFFYRAFTFNNTNLLAILTIGTVLDQVYYTFIFLTLYSVLFCLAVVFKFGFTFNSQG
jgi:phosphatidylglycerophosphate synthase